MPLSVFGNAATVVMLNRALYDQSPAHSTYENQVASAAEMGTVAFANAFGAGLSSLSNAQYSHLLMVNLGLSSNPSAPVLEAALTDYLVANGFANRGLVALQLAQVLSNKEGDATWGAAATAWNAEVATGFGYSSDVANTTPSGVEQAPRTFTLTSGQDDFTGGTGPDSFLATGSTLQAGDALAGGDGTDTLTVSVGATEGGQLTGFTTSSIEEIFITSLATSPVTFDMKMVAGAVTVTSNEGSNAALTLWDIQNVNATKLAVVDTNQAQTFVYDSNAYASGTNTADLTLEEIHSTSLAFAETATGTIGGGTTASHVQALTIHSLQNPGSLSTTSNDVTNLSVGASLATIVIDGNSNLNVHSNLDVNVATVNAGGLAADLTLHDVSATSVGTFSYTGATGNDTLTVARTGNNSINLNTGNDSLMVTGNGNQSIEGGTGNDAITVTGDGQDDISLGAGNDSLVINGRVDDYNDSITADDRSLIGAGDGNDSITINGEDGVAGSYTITLDAGNDYLAVNGSGAQSVSGGEGNDAIYIDGAGNQTVDSGAGNDLVDLSGGGNDSVVLGDGDDALNISGNGNNTVTAGQGNDDVTIEGNGNQVITGNAGNDDVVIAGNGKQNVNLGEGDDYLLINGSAANVLDNASSSLVSTIVGGDGNDTVDVRFDHVLDASLGNGNDEITLRARDLTSIDTVAGGAGSDTMILTNEGDGITNGLVRMSETRSTSGFETFDLRDAKINLHLTDNLFDTAEGTSITVTTENATGLQTVDLTEVATYFEGFTLAGGEYRDIVVATDEEINGHMTLNFGGASDTPPSPHVDDTPYNVPVHQDTLRVVNGAEITAADLVNVTGMERIELVATGNQGPQTWSIELTDNVINQPTDINSLVIHVASDIPAGSNLYITLDPTIVNAENDVVIEKNANVHVYINGFIVSEPQLGVTDFNPDSLFSITVVNELNFTSNGDHLVGTGGDDTFTADDLQFIHGSGDSADGMDGEDTLLLNFAVNNPTQTLLEIFDGADIQEIENIVFDTENNVRFDGLGSGFGGLRTLSTGLGDDSLTNMRTGNMSYYLGDGNDSIGLDSAGGSVFVDAGMGSDEVTGSSGGDSISVSNVETINGGGGNDAVDIIATGSQASDGLIWLEGVETIYATGGSDNIYADNVGGSVLLYGEGGDDTLNVGANTPDYATVYGGAGADDIHVHADNSAYVYGDNSSASAGDGNDTIDVSVWNGGATVYGGGGDDGITVDAPFGTVYVDGGNGNDTISVHGEDYDTSVYGGSGDDSITIFNSDGNVYAYGQDGNDTISVSVSDGYYTEVSVDGGAGADDITVNAVGTDTDNLEGADWTIYGGDGNDTITVNASDASDNFQAYISGGSGDDSISVTAFSDEAEVTVYGGDGNDYIFLHADGSDSHSSMVSDGYTTYSSYVYGDSGNDTIDVISHGSHVIVGGSGNDEINLSLNYDGSDADPVSASGGTDKLVFGDITYDALQQVSSDSQGVDTITGYVFEYDGSGPAPTQEDLMDFSDFLNGTITSDNAVVYTDADNTWQHGDEVFACSDSGNSLVVLSTNGLTLTAADFGTDAISDVIQLNDNGRAVVVVGTDATGPGSGIHNFDIYFVQDLDSGYGAGHQTWQVDLVAHVEALTLVGIESVYDNLEVNNVYHGGP